MIHEPKNLTDEQKREIVKRELYKRKGGTICCGHDFQEQVKEADYGDIILCTRCYQYFIKAKALVWWIDGNKTRPPHSNHLHYEKDIWLYPADMRLQDYNGNTIRER